MCYKLVSVVILIVLSDAAYAQKAGGHDLPLQKLPLEVAPPVDSHSDASPTYVLGPGDQISFLVPDIDEFGSRAFRIDMQGNLNLPYAGQVHAAGLTIPALEAEVTERLKRFLKQPSVVAAIASYQSQPVSVLGAVNNPGVRQLEGEKTLYEMLSLAGGLRPNAGNTVHITRDLRWGRIPLADAKDDPTGRFSTASVKVRAIMSAMDPKENIMIKPHDVITVQTAEVVYAVGSINKPGGFVLGENETLSTLQVVSLAEGLQKTAAADRAKILRPVPGSSSERSEIPVNIKKLLAGKAPDVPLKPNDILFVPTSAAKVARYRTVEAIVQSAIGMSVYTRF